MEVLADHVEALDRGDRGHRFTLLGLGGREYLPQPVRGSDRPDQRQATGGDANGQELEQPAASWIDRAGRIDLLAQGSPGDCVEGEHQRPGDRDEQGPSTQPEHALTGHGQQDQADQKPGHRGQGQRRRPDRGLAGQWLRGCAQAGEGRQHGEQEPDLLQDLAGVLEPVDQEAEERTREVREQRLLDQRWQRWEPKQGCELHGRDPDDACHQPGERRPTHAKSLLRSGRRRARTRD